MLAVFHVEVSENYSASQRGSKTPSTTPCTVFLFRLQRMVYLVHSWGGVWMNCSLNWWDWFCV